jgi:Xaa-Pro aminopeptidase
MVHSNPKASKLNTQEIEDLIKASYKNSTDATIIGKKYNLTFDSKLSSPEQKVFIDKKGKPIVVARGSQATNIKNFTRDWLISDALIAVGASNYDPRHKRTQDIYDKVVEKYKKPVALLGHSLAGHLIESVKTKPTDKVITYNKAVGIGDIGKRIKDNQTDIRTGGDIVSALSLTQQYKKGHNIVVPNTKIGNPFLLHSPDFISRIGHKII